MKITEGFFRLKKGKAAGRGRHTGRKWDENACCNDREYEGEAATEEEYGADVEYGEDADYARDTGYAAECAGDADYAGEYAGDADYVGEYAGDADYAGEYAGDADYVTGYGEDVAYEEDEGDTPGREYGEEPEPCEEAETAEDLVFYEDYEATESAGEAEADEGSAGVPEETERPVIKVDNVTMKFKVATSSTSGLKDYVIQKIKKQITTRDLLALDGVSFEVFKGEVAGVIGTNGSGKSTLLKIISGALKPTSGQVIVDQSKIQLLTLGTGFDMELTAKENVYLNGAIIGYSREFIDAHYEEIVAFAELEGFMDTKVKNFSSGMVSRLGFAIATAGDAAEILILDEVLSVGDEFFRKKSLKRIKEMIHGGSTVIMVSHGMGTIRENCTKVIWIEKGVLQMAGDAKTVCRAYQRMERIVTVDS